MTYRRNYIRVPVPVSRPLKVAIKNRALRAVAKGIRIIDISMGGALLSVPYAENIIQAGSTLEFAILLPAEEVCWLSGRIVNVADNTCGVQFDHDSAEQKKISHYVMQREREISGYTKWGKDLEVNNSLAENLLGALWGAGDTAGKKVLFVSASADTPQFLQKKYEVKTVGGVEEAGTFAADLILVDSDNLPFNSYSEFENPSGHPAARKAPVLVVAGSDHEVSYVAITAGARHLSFSMPKGRYMEELPHILDALMSKYGRGGK